MSALRWKRTISGVRMRLAAIVLLVCDIATVITANAQSPEPASCPVGWPEPFPAGKPFLLHDPRSGLILRIETDGRHMAGINRQGKVIWRRDIFSDPNRYRLFPPPPALPGEPSISDSERTRRMKTYVARLSIDRIGITPDCAVRFTDRLPRRFRGHYIRAASGTHISWLLDAATGDLQMDVMN